MSPNATWAILLCAMFIYSAFAQLAENLSCSFRYDDCACNTCILPADAKYCPDSASSVDYECTCQSYELLSAIYSCLQTSGCNKTPGEYMDDVLSVCNIDSGYNVAPVISSVEAAAAATMTFGTQSTATAKASSTGNAATPAPTSTSGSSGSSSNDSGGGNGLSRSDIIALGVGLGVGVPSVLIALATYIKMR